MSYQENHPKDPVKSAEAINIQLTGSQITGLKTGLNEIAQGCITLIKVLSMIQIPEKDKYPKGRD
jgi:hypothetical protein